MIFNYLMLTVRNLRRRMVYSLINVFGLAIGISVCLVIWRYVEFELSYDNFHKNADNLYRATFTEYGKNWKDDWFTTFGYGLGPALSDEIPEVKAYARIHPLYGDAALVSCDNDKGELAIFNEKNLYFTDPAFMRMFTYGVIKGDALHALDDPSSIVVTQSTAKRYFGDADPLGRVLQVKTKDWGDGAYRVTAVIGDAPQNAQLQFDMLLSMHNLLQIDYYRDPEAAWTATNFVTYIEMEEGTDPTALQAKTKRFMDLHTGTEPLGVRLAYQPIRDMNLSPDLNEANGHLNTLYFFLLISFFILSIAWMNYVNLSTARATERAKEVGVKKTMGVTRSQLIVQFIVESLLINLISVIVALCLATALLPVLSGIVGKQIAFDFSQPSLWMVLTGLFLVGAMISGAYPAFVLSSFKPSEAIKGVARGGRGFVLRKALVVFQFTASLLLISGTFVIYRQLNFMINRDKGLNTDRMLIVTGPQIIAEQQSEQRMISFKDELQRISSVKRVTSSGAIPGGGFSFTTGMQKVGSENEKGVRESIHVVWVDPDFIGTYGMQIISGRAWDPQRTLDKSAVFLNETAVRRFGLGNVQQALHEKVLLGDGEPFEVQGVLKDFHWNSLKSEYVPMLFRVQPANYGQFSIQIQGRIPETIAQVEDVYEKFFPDNPFDYYFLDDFFNAQYKDEQQFERIFSLFSALAIIIACLGLWGLASFTTEQRTKEIGIRKVLGATVGSIVSLLSTQFLKLLAIAALISLPVLWYLSTAWMNNFAFRIDFTADMFVVPLLMLSIVAFGTISLQIFRGASTNPAKALRSE